MKAKFFIAVTLTLILVSSAFSSSFSYAAIANSADSIEIEKVKDVIVESYVKGIFLNGDYKLVKKGWHPECDIVVFENGSLNKLPAQYWVNRLKKNPKPLDPSVTYTFSDVKIVGYAAIAVVEIYSEGNHLYTDFMSLYKFDGKWKIVTKIYYTYPSSVNSN